MNSLLLTLVLAAPAGAAEAPKADLAEAFRAPACSTAAAAAWRPLEDPWLKARTDPGWTVADRLDRWDPPASTTTFRRLIVDLDWSLRSSTRPALSMFGMTVPGAPRKAGAWVEETLAHARARGDDALGPAGTVAVGGRGECRLGAVELNARRACADKDAPCRRAALYLDCGGKDGVELMLSAVTPAYPKRGKPDGKAAEALSAIQLFFCTVETKGR